MSDSLQVYKIDKHGAPIEVKTVNSEEATKLGDDWVLGYIDESLTHPRWSWSERRWENGAPSRSLIDQLIKEKKDILSKECEEDILSGFDFEIGDNTYHFSYDREAQVNLQERWQIFQNNMVEEMNITAHLGEEDARLTVNKEVFSKIYMQSVMAKENKIKKLREDLFPLVERAKSQSELDVIRWDMEIIEPKPESIVLKDDKTLDKELGRVESDSAVANNEIINLIVLTNMMGGMG